MFKNNFIASISSNGKFFREDGDSIRIPFGTEYSIYLKNLDSRKCVVKIKIDGEDVLSENRLLLRGNSILELEGFMDGDVVKNKFKFIKRIGEIERYRGIKPEDGIVTVEFDFEKKQPVYVPQFYTVPFTYTYPYPYGGEVTTYGDTFGTYTINSSLVNSSGTINLSSSSHSMSCHNVSDAGITVKGNDTHQQFINAFVGELENNPTTIPFRLLGFEQSDDNKKPVFVKDKLQCSSCGLKSININRFCPRCGTRLDR